MEVKAIEIWARDELLHRLVPAGIVLTFLIVCTLIAIFASVAVGSVGLGAVLATLATAYFKQQQQRSGANQKAANNGRERNARAPDAPE